jgi:hypothetical protein
MSDNPNLIVIDTLEDEDNGIATGGISLRDAINYTNSLPGRNIIEFDSSLSGGTITLTVETPLEISDELKIVGLGAQNITLDGNGKTLFTLNDGFPDEVINVEIEKVRLISNNYGYDSKGIDNSGEELTVRDIIISGGYYNGIENSGILNISNSTIRDNRGNGINSSGTLVIDRNTITDNGNHGIYSGETLEIDRSTIANNGDRGIYSDGSLVIRNSAVAGNDSGIYLRDIGNISNTRIIENNGSGIDAYSDRLNITNSTIADNIGIGVDVGIGNRHVSLGLIIIVIRNKISHCIIRKELFEFAVKLGH